MYRGQTGTEKCDAVIVRLIHCCFLLYNRQSIFSTKFVLVVVVVVLVVVEGLMLMEFVEVRHERRLQIYSFLTCPTFTHTHTHNTIDI